MRCLVCSRLSWDLLCPSCKRYYAKPSPSQRVLKNGLKVNSFFAYEDISGLLHTKHTPHGAKVFTFLAQASFSAFAKTFAFEAPVLAVPIDDHVRHGYSHTAILAKALTSASIRPFYGALRATNPLTYSGKPLAFRKANPRGFTCTLPPQSSVILVDDLITSGQTLLEASALLMKEGITPLFALTLANANVT